MSAVCLALVVLGPYGIRANAQPDSTRARVESHAFAVMLDALLSHSTIEIAVHEITAETDVLLLDARSHREYEVSHLKNALWVGYDDFDTTRVTGIKKDESILVYCSVGYRSEKVAELLIEAGYTNVSNLYGGLFEWKNQGNPVYNQDGPTEDVHAYSRAWGIWLRSGRKVYK